MGLANPVGVGQPRPDLEAAWGAWDPRSRGYIADQVLPPMDVDEESADLGALPKEVFTTYVDAKRAPKAESKSTSFEVEADFYKLLEYSLKGMIPYRHKRAWQSRFRLEEIEVLRQAHMTLRSYEVDVASLVFSTSTFPSSGNTGIAISTKWDNISSGTPVSDMATAHEAFETEHGIKANALVWTRKAMRRVSLNSQVRGSLTDMVGEVKPGVIPVEHWKILFDVDYIIVAGPEAVKNDANSGQPADLQPIWDPQKALLTRIEPGGMDPYAPQLGRTLKLAGEGDVMVKSKEEFDPEGTTIKTNFVRLAKLSKYAPGYLFDTILT